MARTASAFSTGRSGGQAEPRRLEFSAKTGQLSVVEIEADPRSGFHKQATALAVGHKAILGLHSIFHGFVSFAPKFEQRLQPWSPGRPVMSMPPDMNDPIETIKLPLLIEGHGSLGLMLTSVIAINSIKDMLDRLSWTNEAQSGDVPVVTIAAGRPVTLRDRPGETFYAPAFTVVGWISVEAAGLGPRVTATPTATIGHADQPLHRPLPAPAPTTATTTPAGAAAGVPWDLPEPRPLPPVTPSAPAAGQAAANELVTVDPFEVFRRH